MYAAAIPPVSRCSLCAPVHGFPVSSYFDPIQILLWLAISPPRFFFQKPPQTGMKSDPPSPFSHACLWPFVFVMFYNALVASSSSNLGIVSNHPPQPCCQLSPSCRHLMPPPRAQPPKTMPLSHKCVHFYTYYSEATRKGGFGTASRRHQINAPGWKVGKSSLITTGDTTSF